MKQVRDRTYGRNRRCADRRDISDTEYRLLKRTYSRYRRRLGQFETRQQLQDVA